MATSVGFIGVGNMGNPMAGNVLKAFPLTVFDKNPNAMSNLIAAGAQKAATLAVMVGGDAAVLERARPVLRAIGPNIFSVGPVGAGNTVKAINNMMACVNSLAMMEGLVLGRRAGLDPMTIYEVVKASSGGSKALERIPTAIVPRNFAPGFKVALMNKDLETFNTIAKELHVPVSFSNVAQRYQQAAMAAGLADQDTSAAVLIIERLAASQVSKGDPK